MINIDVVPVTVIIIIPLIARKGEETASTIIESYRSEASLRA